MIDLGIGNGANASYFALNLPLEGAVDRICLAKVILKVDLPLIINSAFQKLFKATIGSYAIILSKILHQNIQVKLSQNSCFIKRKTLNGAAGTEE